MKRSTLAALTLSFALYAQDPVIRSNVVAVQVPVTVFAKGRAVSGLTPENFKLFDNGELQKFTLDNSDRPVSLVLAVQTNSPAKKVLPLVQRSAPVMESLITGSTGEVAILGFDRTVQTLQPFTTKPEAIRTTFAKLTVAGSEHRLDDAVLEGIKLLNTREPGRRKILILIGESDGIGSAINTRQVFQQAELNGIMVYALRMKLVDRSIPDVQARNKIPPEARPPLPMGTLQTATTDVQNGNYAPTVASMYEIVRGMIATSALEAYAEMTGARQETFNSQGQLDAAIKRIALEVHNQYLLTFIPSTPTPGFHNLKVDVDAPKADVRARRAYRVATDVR